VVSTAFIKDFLIGEADIASFSCYSKPPASAGGAFTPVTGNLQCRRAVDAFMREKKRVAKGGRFRGIAGYAHFAADTRKAGKGPCVRHNQRNENGFGRHNGVPETFGEPKTGIVRRRMTARRGCPPRE
jgi:hypothetical protein